jgi:hypothetical protein
MIIDQDKHTPIARLVDDRFRTHQNIGRATVKQLFKPQERIGGRIPVSLSEPSQTIRV